MKQEYNITRIIPGDLSHIASLRPPRWSTSPDDFIRTHYGKPYFRGFALRHENTACAIGCLLMFGTSAWLAQIIVHNGFRLKGMGTAITRHLIETAHNEGISTISLIATDDGHPLYTKLGFRDVMPYLFLAGPQLQRPETTDAIRPILKDDFDAVLDLDRLVMSEDRSNIISSFLDRGYSYHENGNITGFFLPEAGDGIIIALNPRAGTDLLEFKHSGKQCTSVIPEKNINAIDYLLNAGFTCSLKAMRMVSGDDTRWKPGNIYCRMAGYSG